MNWSEFDGGSVIGKPGTEGGDIVKDEELDSAARITLEKLSEHYAVTCGVYGTFFHTAYFDAADAFSEYENMKSDIEAIVRCDGSGDDYYRLIKEFVDRY